MKTNVHSGNRFRSRFRLFVFLRVFVSRNRYLHLQYICTESEDSSCRSKRTFLTSPFSHCFINPRIFSVNIVNVNHYNYSSIFVVLTLNFWRCLYVSILFRRVFRSLFLAGAWASVLRKPLSMYSWVSGKLRFQNPGGVEGGGENFALWREQCFKRFLSSSSGRLRPW